MVHQQLELLSSSRELAELVAHLVSGLARLQPQQEDHNRPLRDKAHQNHGADGQKAGACGGGSDLGGLSTRQDGFLVDRAVGVRRRLRDHRLRGGADCRRAYQKDNEQHYGQHGRRTGPRSHCLSPPHDRASARGLTRGQLELNDEPLACRVEHVQPRASSADHHGQGGQDLADESPVIRIAGGIAGDQVEARHGTRR